MISQTAEHALRAIVYLGGQRGRAYTTSQISVATDAPPNDLAKVLKDLKRAGILEFQRGLQGGFALAKDPGDVTVLHVAAAVGAFQRMEHCPLGRPAFTSGLCPLQRRMDNVMSAAENSIDGITIAEILDEPNLLCSLPCLFEPVRSSLATANQS